jgi:hypothetical protein
LNTRRLVTLGLLIAGGALIGWTYMQSLVPAIHPDHDHGLENIAGGGQLRVEALGGGRRNLVGRPDRVLILHWFEISEPTSRAELPALIDYARSVEDEHIEVVLVAMGMGRDQVLHWAQTNDVPTQNLYADPQGKTAGLIGVRRTPETLIYDPEGQLVHQARGPMEWNDPGVRAGIEAFAHGGGEGHTH